MIQAEGDPQRRDEYLQKLMELPNQVSSLRMDVINEFSQLFKFLRISLISLSI